MKKIILGTLVLVVVLVGIFSFRESPSEKLREESGYEILKKWELPDALKEISGLTWIGNERVACVQDEDGKIFIYNLKTSKIEKEIPFGNGGDYEGIAVVKGDAFVLRSDGIIFEISDFEKGEPQVRKHVTGANQLQGINLEGLCADASKNHLLLAVKERRNSEEQKEIFAFDLDNSVSAKDPLFLLNLSDPIFDKVNGKNKGKFSPGEIGLHPQTGEYYILDGTRPKLLITGKDGKPKKLFLLRAGDFGNPEGLTFSPQGDLYISNEAKDGPANILLISLKGQIK